jgi:hypothetical protein
MGNMPTMGIDPDGQFWHILAGAVIGGGINVATHWEQAKATPWGFIKAFSVGAVAGAVTATTGGAAAGALGLSSTGIASGLVTGGVGAFAGDPFRGLGNAAFFGDSYTLKDYGTGILAGAILGGAVGGISAKIAGTNWWNGAPNATGFGTFSPPRLNNEAIATQGWAKGFNGSWVNNAAPSGYGQGGNGVGQFPNYTDGAGKFHKGGVFKVSDPTKQLTKSTFGHTFKNHGAEATKFTINRARGLGVPSGQFMDNQATARFILNNLNKASQGSVSVPIPQNFPARIIMPDGTFRAATHIRIVPSGVGVKTAYPELLKR